jgi:uncharacterized protein with GYD domain
MPMYVVLGKLTGQGATNIRELPQRARQYQAMGQQRGMKIHGWYLTGTNPPQAAALEGGQ